MLLIPIGFIGFRRESLSIGFSCPTGWSSKESGGEELFVREMQSRKVGIEPKFESWDIGALYDFRRK